MSLNSNNNKYSILIKKINYRNINKYLYDSGSFKIPLLSLDLKNNTTKSYK